MPPNLSPKYSIIELTGVCAFQEKAAALPPEPPLEESVTSCLIRLPNGARFSRRFRASDPLLHLFDFVDAQVPLPIHVVWKFCTGAAWLQYCNLWIFGLSRVHAVPLCLAPRNEEFLLGLANTARTGGGTAKPCRNEKLCCWEDLAPT